VIVRSIVAMSVLAATPALADSPTPPPLPGEHEAAAAFAAAIDYEHRVRWQSELALFLGPAPIDHVLASTTPGYTLATGMHLDRLTVLAEYTIAELHYLAPSASASAQGEVIYADTYGLSHRIGVANRYSFVKLESGEGISRWFGELWLEAGTGVQIARWDRGGTFVRPDVSFGIGMQGARRASAARRGGAYVALRVQLARRTDIDSPPTCSAPCTMASPPASWTDRSALLHVGFLFGN
jgi:hypothetical protein